MSMAAEVFRRFEKKYLLEEEVYHRVITQIEKRMQADRYSGDGGFYTICNLYLDSWDDAYVRESISKPGYKEKLRLRSYGTPVENGQVYLEIKKKQAGVVFKRRCRMALEEAYSFVERGLWPESVSNPQVAREIAYLQQRREALPKVYLAYDRQAFFDDGSEGLRVTFDHNIRSRRYDLQLENGDFGFPLLREGYVVMEVKTLLGIPCWLTELLSGCGVYPTGFSKYGAEYLRGRSQQQREEGKLTCLTPFLAARLMPLSPLAERSLAS